MVIQYAAQIVKTNSAFVICFQSQTNQVLATEFKNLHFFLFKVVPWRADVICSLIKCKGSYLIEHLLQCLSVLLS